MNNEAPIDSSKIKTLSWLKYLQCILLMAVGGAFSFYNLSLFDNPEEVFRVIAFALGILFTVFGGLSLLTGYIIDRSPFSQNVIFGLAFFGLGFVCILSPNVIYEISTTITISSLLAFAFVFFIHSFYLIGSKKKRNKRGLLVTLSFFGSIICVVLVLLYFFADINFPKRYNNGIDGGERMIGIILGPSMILIGFASIIVTAKRAKNTKIYFTNNQTAQQPKKETTTSSFNTKSDFSTSHNFNYTKAHNTFNNKNTTSTAYKYASPKKDTFASSFGFSGAKTTTNTSTTQNTASSQRKEEEPEIIDIRPKN